MYVYVCLEYECVREVGFCVCVYLSVYDRIHINTPSVYNCLFVCSVLLFVYLFVCMCVSVSVCVCVL